MARADTMESRTAGSRKAKDADVVVGNGLATIGVGAAIALAVIGLLTGFDIFDTDRPFENGLLWLASGLVAALCANAFRREHHVIDVDEQRLGGGQMSARFMSGGAERPLSGGAERPQQGMDRDTYTDPGMQGRSSGTKRGSANTDPNAQRRSSDMNQGRSNIERVDPDADPDMPGNRP